MRIVIFPQHLAVGGAMRQLVLQGDALRERGHDVSVVGLHRMETEWQAWWPPGLGSADSLLERPHRNRLREAFALMGAARRLRRKLKRERVDVLYAYHGNLARFLGWAATYATQTTLVWGLRGAGRTYSPRRGLSVWLPFYACREASRFVPLLIANSERASDRREAAGFRCGRFVTIANGFDTETFKPDADARARVRREWGIGDEPVVALVGRLQPEHKRHDVFLRAAARVADKRAEVRWVIVGDGAAKDRVLIEGVARDVGMFDRVVWTGFRGDMAAVYNAVDILCSASWREGFPNVVGEAMACGVPCVVTDAGASAEIVGDSGIVVPPDDVDALAAALETMLAGLTSVRAEDVRALIVERFSLERCAEATERELDAAARSFPRASSPASGARPEPSEPPARSRP
jgi:glycosyltransferase involved in cell wall biosynthesis